MSTTSEEHNYYRTLGLRPGAQVWEVEEAAARLIIQAASARDYFRIDRLEEARHWLTTPALRAFHDEKLQSVVPVSPH
ncbi:MAG: hypothetical protein WD990_08120 [Acidimicrobiia bacterium]